MDATDALVLIGDGMAGEAVAEAARRRGLPVLDAKVEPSQDAAARLSGTRVLAVSGIGRPEKFAATLRDAGAQIVAEHAFGDHHAYAAGDVSALIATAKAQNCAIATTEKDMTKLGPLWPETERALLIVVPVTLRLAEPGHLTALLDRAARKT